MPPQAAVAELPRLRPVDGLGEAVADIGIDYGDRPPLLPDGKYQAVLTHHETAFVFRSPKVFLWFKVVEPGEHFGKLLHRPYRVKSLEGKPRRNGGFRLKPSMDLFAMICRVCDLRARPDRISLLPLRHCVLQIRTRTVTKDYQQREIPDWLRYSVVDDVLGKVTG